MWGGIEVGGTKFVCAVGEGPDLLAEVRFPTTTPGQSVARAVEFLRRNGPLEGVGIASFGPLDLAPGSSTFGYVAGTPKPGWAHFDLLGAVRRALGGVVAIDTDVNAAALGEYRWGAARGLGTFVYITVGTGIGGGAMVNGELLHGLTHPEMGHLRLPHDWARDPYAGCCPYHGDCLEGLASGPAMEERWGCAASELPPEHPAWELEAGYLAAGVADIVCVLSPQAVIMGGGVMSQEHLLPLVRERVAELLGGYLPLPDILPPGLGERAGVLGAIALAQASR